MSEDDSARWIGYAEGHPDEASGRTAVYSVRQLHADDGKMLVVPEGERHPDGYERPWPGEPGPRWMPRRALPVLRLSHEVDYGDLRPELDAPHRCYHQLAPQRSVTLARCRRWPNL